MKTAFLRILIIALLFGGIKTVSATITLLSPNGGEVINNNRPMVINWSATPGVTNVRIELVRFPNMSFRRDIVSNTDATLGTYTWSGPDLQQIAGTNLYRVIIYDLNSTDKDTSNANFTIINGAKAQDDVVNTYTDSTKQFNVRLNDISHNYPGNFSILVPPTQGIAQELTAGNFDYTSNSAYIGTDSFTYQLCEVNYPTICDTATVHINVYCKNSLVANAGNDTTGCYNQNITIGGSPTATGGTPPYSYTWYRTWYGDSISNLANPSIDHSQFDLRELNIIVTDANNCAAFDSILLRSDSLFWENVTQPCNGNDGEIELTDYIGGVTYTYLWSTNAPNNHITGLNPGIYTVTVTSSLGCERIDTFELTRLLADAGRDTVLCGTGTVLLGGAPTAIDGTPQYVYSWSPAAGLSNPNIANPLANVTATTTFTVTVTDAGGCSATDTVRVTTNAGIIITVDSTKIPNCITNNDGAIYISVTGGVGPHSYLWSNFSGSPQIQNVPKGTYEVIVTDINTCSARLTYSLGDTINITLDSLKHESCLNADGGIYISVTGNTTGYSYAWSNNTATQDIEFLMKGTYLVTVTDNKGCTAIDSFQVLRDSAIIALDSIKHVDCSAGTLGSIYISVAGGTPNYNYLWSTFQGSQDITNLLEGLHIVIVTDAEGCQSRAEFTILNINSNITPLLINDTLACYTDSVRLTYPPYAAGGTPPYNFSWSTLTAPNFSLAENLAVKTAQSETYTVVVTDNNGCIGLDTITVYRDTCVWPGDANYDGIVNGDDVLRLGVGFEVGGYRRNNPNPLTWVGQISTNWAEYFADGFNYKHADCNGDSIINHNDTVPIDVNYTLTHARAGWQNGNRATDPLLYSLFSPDTTYASGVLNIKVNLGTDTMPLTQAYGIAFRMHLPADKVESITGINFTGSWMLSGNSNPITFRKQFLQQGYLDIAAVRTDHNNTGGYGLLADVGAVMKDDISGKMDSLITREFVVSYSNVTLIDAQGNIIPVYAQDDTTIVAQILSSLREWQMPRVSVYPNPANGFVMVEANQIIETIEVVSVLGVVSHVPIFKQQQKATIDISSLSNGSYILKVGTTKGEQQSRIIKY